MKRRGAWATVALESERQRQGEKRGDAVQLVHVLLVRSKIRSIRIGVEAESKLRLAQGCSYTSPSSSLRTDECNTAASYVAQLHYRPDVLRGRGRIAKCLAQESNKI
jgi:hypothetical protein